MSNAKKRQRFGLSAYRHQQIESTLHIAAVVAGIAALTYTNLEGWLTFVLGLLALPAGKCISVLLTFRIPVRCEQCEASMRWNYFFKYRCESGHVERHVLWTIGG